MQKPAITKITVCNTVPPMFVNEEGEEDTMSSALDCINTVACKLVVPESAAEAYRNANGWKRFTNIIGGVTNAISNIENDYHSGVVDVYTIDGVKVAESTDGLTHGMYIIKTHGCNRKVIVK